MYGLPVLPALLALIDGSTVGDHNQPAGTALHRSQERQNLLVLPAITARTDGTAHTQGQPP